VVDHVAAVVYWVRAGSDQPEWARGYKELVGEAVQATKRPYSVAGFGNEGTMNFKPGYSERRAKPGEGGYREKDVQ